MERNGDQDCKQRHTISLGELTAAIESFRINATLKESVQRLRSGMAAATMFNESKQLPEVTTINSILYVVSRHLEIIEEHFDGVRTIIEAMSE